VIHNVAARLEETLSRLGFDLLVRWCNCRSLGRMQNTNSTNYPGDYLRRTLEETRGRNRFYAFFLKDPFSIWEVCCELLRRGTIYVSLIISDNLTLNASVNLGIPKRDLSVVLEFQGSLEAKKTLSVSRASANVLLISLGEGRRVA
jgi:hypothetical protein